MSRPRTLIEVVERLVDLEEEITFSNGQDVRLFDLLNDCRDFLEVDLTDTQQRLLQMADVCEKRKRPQSMKVEAGHFVVSATEIRQLIDEARSKP